MIRLRLDADKACSYQWNHYGKLSFIVRLLLTLLCPRSPYDAMRSNWQAVSPRFAARSASLKLGVSRTSSIRLWEVGSTGLWGATETRGGQHSQTVGRTTRLEMCEEYL